MADLILNNWFIIILLAVIAIGVIAIAVLNLLSTERSTLLAGGLVIIGLLAGYSAMRGSSIYVVPPNAQLMIIDRATGKPEPAIQKAGVIDLGLGWQISKTVMLFPSHSDYQFCRDYSPSDKQGLGLKVSYCFTLDATKINWSQQFAKWNADAAGIMNAWQTEIQEGVARGFSALDAKDLRTKGADLTAAINNNVGAWFETNVTIIKTQSLKDWNFSDPAIGQTFDQSNLNLAKAQTDKSVAELERETQKIRATTALQSCQAAGFTTQGDCLSFLQYIWLSGQTSNPNIIVSAGNGQQPNVAVPLQPVQ